MPSKKYTNIKDLILISESALESALAGFWDWNMVTNHEYLSPRFKSMFGYKEHEMENNPEAWQKIAFQEDLPKMFESFDNHIKSKGKSEFKSVVRYHHKNGKIIWIRCNGKVVEWSDEGKPLRAIGCHIDITEEKELEIKLKKTLTERNILLKEVHHRVKNNLQLIISLARLKNRKVKININDIEDSIHSIASAYEAIYKSERFDKISIEDYLNKIINPILLNQNINFILETTKSSKDIDFLIPIGLIVTELVNNTLKHAFSKSLENKIYLSVKETDESLLIIYKDNGIGFSNEFLNSVLKIKSYGINIVNSLVKQLNGEIQFSNEGGAKIQIKINLLVSKF